VNKIELYNFRQFFGKQVIDFSSGDKNITLVKGNNGYGKTGIFRALIFGLYGETHLSQDNKNEEIHLVNFKAIRENREFITQAKVKVFFETDFKKYCIERSVKANREHSEQIGSSKLDIIDENGNYTVSSTEDDYEIKLTIEKIIGSDIKEFFFFDGEKIETLAKTTKQVKKEIKNAIVKLLQIEIIESASKLLGSLYNKEKTNISRKAKELNLENIQHDIEDISANIEKIDKKIEETQVELDECSSEIEENEKTLQNNKKILDLQKRINTEKEKKVIIQKSINDKVIYLKEEFFNYSHCFFIKENYSQTLEYLKQIQKSQPNDLSINIIEQILEEKKCICGQNLEGKKEILEHFKKRKEQYKHSELILFLKQLIHETQNYDEIISEKIASLRDRLKDINEENKELIKRKKLISSLNEEIKRESKTEKDLEKIESQLEDLREEYEKLNETNIRLQYQKKVKSEEQKDLESEYDQQLKKNTKMKFYSIYLEKIKALKNGFEANFNIYSDKMRQELMTKTTEIFNKIVDYTNVETISKIKINEKYELEVYNYANEKMTQDISQGQRQIIALSFITALASMAVVEKDNKIFPLFMDTPFARIDGKNRPALIKILPKLTNQLILLLTDTELSDKEILKFKDTKKIGKWYELTKTDKDSSTISEKSIF